MEAKTILLVDDHENFSAVLADELMGWNNSLCVQTAKNGEKAAEILGSERVDLVVTDLSMPVMGGFDLISYLKKHHPAIPVIVVSSYLHPESEKRLGDLGVSQFVDKNFLSVSDLEKMILQNLEGL